MSLRIYSLHFPTSSNNIRNYIEVEILFGIEPETPNNNILFNFFVKEFKIVTPKFKILDNKKEIESLSNIKMYTDTSTVGKIINFFYNKFHDEHRQNFILYEDVYKKTNKDNVTNLFNDNELVFNEIGFDVSISNGFCSALLSNLLGKTPDKTNGIINGVIKTTNDINNDEKQTANGIDNEDTIETINGIDNDAIETTKLIKINTKTKILIAIAIVLLLLIIAVSIYGFVKINRASNEND